MARIVLVITALVLAVLSCGCKSKESTLFGELYASDLALGIHLTQSSSEVQAVLGAPVGSTTRQGGVTVEEYYLPEGETSTDPDTPQLSCTYVNDSLVRVYNRYHPDDTDKPRPPFFMEPLPGVKLGNRKSDFVTALGPPARELFGHEWRFADKDGRSVTILAQFSRVPLLEEDLCSMLQAVYSPSIDPLIGEDQATQDWRELK